MNSSPSVKVLALIPAHNESRHIVKVIQETARHLPVLVVNDGSTDNTAALAESAGAVVLNQIPNQGKGVALLTGFQYALQNGYDAVITLDGDGQHDPAEIPAFVEAFTARQGDLIIGARNFRQMPFTRRIANTTGRVLFSWAIGQPIRDNQSGYRLISRRLMQATPNSRERGFEFEVEMIVRCVLKGCRLDWVPIRTIYADQGSHISPLKHALGFLQLVWRTHQMVRRSRREMELE